MSPALAARIETLIRPAIRDLRAYAVPDAGGLIKLDAMENPYVWPEDMQDAWLERLRPTQINRYPHPQAPELLARLRAHLRLAEDQGLLLGNGSDELIQLLVLALAVPGGAVLSVDPGFVMYRMIAGFAGVDYLGVPLRSEDFSLDRARLLETIHERQPALIFLAYPNNPTGNAFSRDDLLAILAAAEGLVVIDEAYAPFTDASFLDQLEHWPNLLVLRTLSKLGLAGLRLGYLVGPRPWLEQLDKLRLPYNINVLTQVSAAFALEHWDRLQPQIQAIRAERDRLQAALQSLPGVQAYPSEANFLLFRLLQGPALAPQIHEALRRRGVLIKNLHQHHPLLDNCLRVTVGTPQENACFLDSLRLSLPEAAHDG